MIFAVFENAFEGVIREKRLRMCFRMQKSSKSDSQQDSVVDNGSRKSVRLLSS
jgi:hypothetical protein